MLLATELNETMALIHDRMPVLLRPEDYDTRIAPSPNARSGCSSPPGGGNGSPAGQHLREQPEECGPGVHPGGYLGHFPDAGGVALGPVGKQGAHVADIAFGRLVVVHGALCAEPLDGIP